MELVSSKSEKSSLTLYREINFSWGKRLYIKWRSREDRSGTEWLQAGGWQLKGIRNKKHQQRKVTAMARWRGCYVCIIGLFGNWKLENKIFKGELVKQK
jgi:hypothetical protein